MKVKVKLLSSAQLFVTLWTVAYQALLSMGFSRQEYWSGLPFPSPGDLPDPGIEPRSPTLQADALTSEPPGKLLLTVLPEFSHITTRKVGKCKLGLKQRVQLNLRFCYYKSTRIDIEWQLEAFKLKKKKIGLKMDPYII